MVMMTRMTKAILAVIGIVAVAVSTWIAAFYQQNLRGIGPAVTSPPQDIVQLIQHATSSKSGSANSTSMPLQLPPGFSVSIVASGLGDPRVLLWDDLHSVLLVSVPAQGKVLALNQFDGTGRAQGTKVIASGLNTPHGLALSCPTLETCRLFVAENNKVTVFDYDAIALNATNPRKLVDLPSGGEHVTRTLLLTSDDRLLISVGSSCNACQETDDRRAKVLVVHLDGTGLKTYAAGLRNSVFLRTRPGTSEIWGTEMGRDFLGDDLPPDELNQLVEGKDYGWPVCYGKNVHDTVFDKNVYIRDPCADKIPSWIDLPAHSAPLGFTFVPSSDAWPKDWWGDLIVAFHGSWNRSVPTGYKLVHIKLDASGKSGTSEDFISGWLTKSGGALGRPVDVILDGQNNLLISDDKAGVIYRVKPN